MEGGREMIGLSSSVLHYCICAKKVIKACMQMWTPHLLCLSSLLRWGLLPCLTMLPMHQHYDHEGNITMLPQRVIKSFWWVGIGWFGCGWQQSWMVGFHLSNSSRITSLLFLSPSVPWMKKPLNVLCFGPQHVLSGALPSLWQISTHNELGSSPQCCH